MSLTQRLDAFQRRHPWAGYPLAVIYKAADDQVNYLAALIAYYGFLSLFPLLLLLASILGIVLRGNPALQARILETALTQFPVIGEQLVDPEGLGGRGWGLVVGLVVSLYGGMKVSQATQHAMNILWAVPRDRRPDVIRSRARSLVLLATVGVAVLATTVLSALGSSAEAFGASIGVGVKAAVTLASVVLNTAVFVLGFRVTTSHPLPLREHLPGAVTAAVVWQLLQSFGAAYVGYVVKDASATNGVFALVLGLVAWIYLGAATVLLCAEINVVRAKHLYPRALLTPFTDAVDLTTADERAYAQYAKAERAKGFESVDVSFEGDDPEGSIRAPGATGER
ncbi:MAG: YihY/virulence factor BrkB family protein [Actinomycetota bacterium]|nr:YihY/virulence factor BrkB family protein [Actinomycetota bacterium]